MTESARFRITCALGLVLFLAAAVWCIYAVEQGLVDPTLGTLCACICAAPSGWLLLGLIDG